MQVKVHQLKTWNPYYDAIISGKKKFEVRKDDRNFQVGDTLLLREWNPDTKEYSGRKIAFEIGYKLCGNENLGIKDGYCILGLTNEMLCDGLEIEYEERENSQHPTNANRESSKLDSPNCEPK